jgi:hypothetical protein
MYLLHKHVLLSQGSFDLLFRGFALCDVAGNLDDGSGHTFIATESHAGGTSVVQSLPCASLNQGFVFMKLSILECFQGETRERFTGFIPAMIDFVAFPADDVVAEQTFCHVISP